MSHVISMRAAVKRYPGFQLGPLELAVGAGTAVALVGPNGAGKTTLMDLLAGVLTPEGGEIEILGERDGSPDPHWKAAVGYANDQQPFYENWTVRRNLNFLAHFFPAWSVDLQEQLVERFELPLDKRVKQLSQGNRSKLSLVTALAHRPRLVLLDEPTAGLDPLMRTRLLDTLRDYLEDGKGTILYSTHILGDVGRLAHELVFIRNGQLMLRAAIDHLERDIQRVSFRLEGAPVPAPITEQFLSHRVQGSQHLAVTRNVEGVLDSLYSFGASHVESKRLTLEEIAVHVLEEPQLPLRSRSIEHQTEPSPSLERS